MNGGKSRYENRNQHQNSFDRFAHHFFLSCRRYSGTAACHQPTVSYEASVTQRVIFLHPRDPAGRKPSRPCSKDTLSAWWPSESKNEGGRFTPGGVSVAPVHFVPRRTWNFLVLGIPVLAIALAANRSDNRMKATVDVRGAHKKRDRDPACWPSANLPPKEKSPVGKTGPESLKTLHGESPAPAYSVVKQLAGRPSPLTRLAPDGLAAQAYRAFTGLLRPS